MRRVLGFLLKYPLQAALGVVLAYAAVQTVRLHRAQAHARQLGFDKLALEAKADTQRAVNRKAQLALIQMYGENYRGVEKLIVQQARLNTKLGTALGQQTALVADLTVTVRDLNAKLAGTPVVTLPGDVRTAAVDTTLPPYHVKVSASLPPSPQPGTFALWIRQDPLVLHVHAGCLPRNADGLRPASLTVATDSLRPVSIGQVSQDRDVCNPEKASAGARVVRDVKAAAVGIGVWETAKAVLRLLKVLP